MLSVLEQMDGGRGGHSGHLRQRPRVIRGRDSLRLVCRREKATRFEPAQYLSRSQLHDADSQSVVEQMAAHYATPYANPASVHSLGQVARRELERIREEFAALLGVNSKDGHQVLFTSGGTESNNLAIRGLAGSNPGKVLISAIEHESVLAAAESLSGLGFQVSTIPVSRSGVVDLEGLEGRIGDTTRLVSVMLANNETGALQPIAEIAEICRRHDVPFHTDAVQAVGKHGIHFSHLGVDALSFSAHKFHGPTGIGGLVIRSPKHLTAAARGRTPAARLTTWHGTCNSDRRNARGAGIVVGQSRSNNFANPPPSRQV